MKRIYLLISIVPFLFSCVQEQFGDKHDGTDTEVFSFEALIVNTDVASKTYFGDKEGIYYPNYWAAGDAISVNGTTSEPLSADSPFVATDKATFEVKGSLATPYHYVYPASSVVSYSDNSATINLPEIQKMYESTYDPSAFLMVGTSVNEVLSFSPLMSAVKLTVPVEADIKVRSVTFMSLGQEKVSGDFITDFSTLTPSARAFSHVHVTAPDGGAPFGTDIYILIPAQIYADGVAFAVRATDGTRMVYYTKERFTANPGIVYPLTTKTYVPDPEMAPLMLMSSNVRFASAKDKDENPDTGDRIWDNRKEAYFAMVNTLQPDIVGLQEAEKVQVKDIKAGCSGYSHIGWGRESGKDITSDGSFWGFGGAKDDEESTTILYRTDKFSVQSSGKFWHSDRPSTADSYFSEMTDKQPRISTWAVMTHLQSGRQFFYLNSHLSLYSAAQEKEVRLIASQVAELNTGNLPVVLSADWNLEEDSSIMSPITSQFMSARQTASVTDNYATYHWWGTEDKKKLDHIFYSGFSNCSLFKTVRQKWNNMYISDHYPVYVLLNFKNSYGFEVPDPVVQSDVDGNRENYLTEDLFD